MTLRVTVLDIEIARGVLLDGENPEPGINYCDGWHDHTGMGIASVVTMTTSEAFVCSNWAPPRIWMHDNRAGLLHELDQADLIVTYNGWKFDAPVLAANGWGNIPQSKHYDLLREIWRALGKDPDVFDETTHSNYGLNKMCQENNLPGKVGHGAQAPIDFQLGSYGSLTTYNVDDVFKTAELYERATRLGHLWSPRDSSAITGIRSGVEVLESNIEAA